MEISNHDRDFVQARFGTLPIDILLTQNPLYKKVQRKYSMQQHFLDREIPLATVEGLLLLKLYALPSLYWQGNFARVGIYENDIATLLQAFKPDVPPLLDELSQNMNENDLVEIKNILSDIQDRIARFNKESR